MQNSTIATTAGSSNGNCWVVGALGTGGGLQTVEVSAPSAPAAWLRSLEQLDDGAVVIRISAIDRKGGTH